jgi:hypothetical protein
MRINCIAIFCEDIREEAGGTHTIVGVMPQNIGLSPPSASEKDAEGAILFPKLGIYIRVHFHISERPTGAIAAKVVIPGGHDVSLGEMGTEKLDEAVADSISKNNSMVGVIFKAVAAPLQVSESGTLRALVTVDGEEIECGTLHMNILR